MVYGVVEVVVTMGVVIYLQQTDPALLRVQVKTTDTSAIPAEASA